MKMFTLLAVIFAIFIPIAFLVWKEWGRKKTAADKTVAAVKTAEPFDVAKFIRVVIVLVAILLPAVYLSDASFSFYKPETALLKIAFKHSGKRIVDCDETALIKQAGQMYRKSLKDVGRVSMDNAMMNGCPRERYPVSVNVMLDGAQLLRKDFSPTGIKNDMASYVYDEFTVKPGERRVTVSLWDTGRKETPDYSLDETVSFADRQTLLIRVDDVAGKLVIE